MTKKLSITALSLLLAAGFAGTARAEIIDYGTGYGGYPYGTNGYSTYPYGGSYPYGTGYPYGSQYGYGYPSSSNMVLSRDLTIGSYGADVQALESFLMSRGFMNAPGVGYFSLATRDGVARFQASNGISPAAGYVGPLTRMYINALMAGGSQYGNQYGTYPYMYPYSYQGGCPSGTHAQYYGSLIGCVSNSSNNNSNGNNGGLNGGSADLTNFRLDDGSDTTMSEGDTRAEAFRARFDVDNGDVRVERVDVRFEFAGNSNDADDQPWQVFDRARLIADGDTIADVDVSRRGAWDSDGNGYVLRLDDLDDYVVNEGDQADLRLELDVQDDVQGASQSNRAVWDLSIPDDGIRAVDGDDDNQTIGDDNDTVRIRIRN